MGHPPVEAAASVSEAAAFPSLNTLGRLLCCLEARDAEVLIERPDGSRITVVVNIRPLKNGRDDIIGAVNCFYDVTARKETEEALRDSDRRKSEFLAMLAHELRNPLAPIRHSLEVLRRSQKLESSPSTGRSLALALA